MGNNIASTIAVVDDSDYSTQRKKPMPSFNHGSVQFNLSGLFYINYRKEYRVVSEVTFLLDDWHCVPDLSILPHSNYDPTNDQIKTTEAPLGVVEILSPTQSQSELVSKARQYFQSGVQSVWIVFPELQNVYVFSSPVDYVIYRVGETLRDQSLTIELPVAEFFE